MFAAHSQNSDGVRHSLATHLLAVAKLASQFAAPLAAGQLAYYLGLWHDLGKFSLDFQRYLAACESGQPISITGPDHKAAGALLAEKHLGLLALSIQGHHGGLRSPQEFKTWLREKQATELAKVLETARAAMPGLEPADSVLALPTHAQSDSRAAEMFIRLVFSALVDADFLDTESHFQGYPEPARGAHVPIAELWDRFQINQRGLTGRQNDLVSVMRHQIYEACLRAASEPPGLFRLTVPTGGGKTRSGLAFALKHAIEHQKERVIAVVPYISITEQTAAVYRELLELPTDRSPVVLEHHSGSTQTLQEESPEDREMWIRLASENWDASVVVTTGVQFFESLFSNSPSRCRKLHRLANSVIIIDEAQTLPPGLLAPALDALRELCLNYGASVVLSTATQPAFESIPPFRDIPAREIVPNPGQFFSALKRVNYEWLIHSPVSWADVAEIMHREEQALAILNTKGDALALLDALEDENAFHLSTLLCGAHRHAVIGEIKRRLAARENCRLVSTQVVEAGVDFDFPLVLRALGPLDGLIQAAGRCNREGLLARGKVLIFEPEDAHLPAGAYRTAAGVTRAILGQGGVNLDDPSVIRQYFAMLYASVETDRDSIQSVRASFDYPEVARRFTLIGENTATVVVTSYGSTQARQRLRDLVRQLRRGSAHGRSIMRLLQPYLVNLPARTAEDCRRQGTAVPIQAGLDEWVGEYDPVRGLVLREIQPLIV